MALFVWDSSYETGIEQIDLQHQHLFGLINELFDAMNSGQEQAVLDHVLDSLVDYVQLHFTTEEDSMRRHGYPGLEQHLQLHLALTTHVLELKSRRKRGEPVGLLELTAFLCDWLRNHITSNDKEFGLYLNKQLS